MNYVFWRAGDTKRDRFVRPIIVGLYGNASTFNQNRLQLNESLGQPVSPTSLFEAQLRLRMGELLAFIDDLKQDWRSN